MNKRSLFEITLALIIPIAGAMGYVHGTFAQKSTVQLLIEKVNRTDKLVCRMAIKQKLEDAVQICTDLK